MRKLTLTLIFCGICSTSSACDEACKREKLATTQNIHFPAHVSLKSCQTTVSDFLLNARKSLASYQEKQLPTAHRGGANNIRAFINARKDWLKECDNYMRALELGSVFRKDETTADFFNAFDNLTLELGKLIKLPSTKEEDTAAITQPSSTGFDRLFSLMDKHLIDLQKRGIM